MCALQVQLLVSEQDVENYKQIKTDLDQLRLTVEKSELWVEKSSVYNGEDLGVRPGKEQNIEVPCCLEALSGEMRCLRIDCDICVSAGSY